MAYREGVKTIAYKILDSAMNGVPYSLQNMPWDVSKKLTAEDKVKLEDYLKSNFELWRDSWIVPKTKAIIAKYEKKVEG